MYDREECKTAEPSTSSEWRGMAPHKQPQRLRDIIMDRVSSLVSQNTSLHHFTENVRTFCEILASSLPLDVRTAVMKKVASTMKINSPQDFKLLLTLHLLTDVRHISLKADDLVHLDTDDCHEILQLVKDVPHFRMETLSLENITMEEGLLSSIMGRSPRLHSVRASGELCSQVLTQLQEKPCALRSLHLDSCNVSDEDVVSALVGTRTDFNTLGNIICNGGDVKELQPAALQSLRYLSVESPRLSACGALILLVSLRNLQQIQYTTWSSPIGETLLFLNQINSTIGSFSLTSLAKWQPTEHSLRNLQKLCPRLQKLMIECFDPSLTSLDVLSEFKELTALNLRLVSEELIVSAVKALGKNLLELQVEFEEYSYHTISLDTIKTIQEHCPHLQRLEMKHVNISSNPGDHLHSKNTIALPELKELVLSSAVIQPASLETLLSGNESLESLVLDVNQDALTDTVLATFLKQNSLHRLSSIFLGAGSLSSQALTSLLCLPDLQKLSLDLKRFPFIPVFAFTSLEGSLSKGNFQCILTNIIRDD
ncbi:hypothetical protein C7M84_025018 [Penaeus vannamei]|uniref:F-box/LRR-repeat protein 15/At3g58940/PEG3-like LRR domain-containing protein n=1 Tax=Penaeus vannamei TaxID=6689 RepID=A0A423TZG7_PENVA|nr:uncharacterized protein LOC113802134 [Penaeus vannamei]ROT81838.1 hypothetical protein C7M84_025018 [Penaeus vannamei]